MISLETRSGNARLVRLSAVLLLVGSLAALTICLKVFLPYLEVELARFSTFEICRLFVFDALSVLIFAGSCIALFISGELPNTSSFDKQKWKYLIITPLLMLVVDFAFTSYAVYKEWNAWKSSEVTIGRVIDIRVETNNNVDKYLITYEYSDADGDRYTGFTRMNDLHNFHATGVLQEEYTAQFIDLVRKRQTPFDLSVRYSPKWPAKSWADNLGWDGDGDTLLSLMLIFYPWYLIYFALFASIGYSVFKQHKGWGHVILSVSAIVSQIAFFSTIAILIVLFDLFEAFV